jgi:hypothetical protein
MKGEYNMCDIKIVVKDTDNYYELDVKLDDKRGLDEIVYTMQQDFFKEFGVMTDDIEIIRL